jgi:hypothetical protein
MKHEESESIWSRMSSSFSSKSNKNNSNDMNLIDETDDMETGDFTTLIKKNLSQSIEVDKSYKSFFIALSVGCGFIFLSLIFLPWIAFAPQKFLSFFSLGSLITMFSFIFIHGTSTYCSMLLSKERFIFTIIYFASVFVSIYTAYINQSYILSLVSVTVQVFTLIIFCLSFIPGGKSGINFLLSMAWAPFAEFINRIKGNSQ